MIPYLLSIILFLPAAGAVLVALVPGANAKAIRILSAAITGIDFVLAVYLFATYDIGRGAMIIERAPWLRIPTTPAFNVDYYLGADGLSVPLVLLTAFLSFLAIFISWSIETRVKEYHLLLLALQTGVLGVFMAQDFFLFFLFWEVELIPMYLLIGIWGSGRRLYAATKFLIYTLAGSAFMLIGIIVLFFSAGKSSFDMGVLADQAHTFPLALQTGLFLLIGAAFAVKLPIFPFHTWLPDAHGDAPTAVSVLLAGVLLKMGAYGILRILLGMFPDAAHSLAPLLATFAVVNILYGAFVTIVQKDMKRLVAYSSVSHMGYVLLGVSALNQGGLMGAAMQMFTHGTITGLLFASVGVLYDRAHTREIAAFGGVAHRMPILATVFMIAGLASLGLPALSGFVAEFLVFVGTYQVYQIAAVLGAFGVVLAAGYILWMYNRVFYGPLNQRWRQIGDTSVIEAFPLFALVASIVAVGVYPAVLIPMFESGIKPLLARLGG